MPPSPQRRGKRSVITQPVSPVSLVRRLEAVAPVAQRAARYQPPQSPSAQRWALEEVNTTLDRLAAQRVCEFLVVSDDVLLREWQAVAASGMPPDTRADLAAIAALRPLGRLALVGWQLGHAREASALHPLTLAEDILARHAGRAPTAARTPPVGWKSLPQIRIGQWLLDEIAASSWPETPMRRLLLRIERLLNLLDEWRGVPVEVCLMTQRRGAPCEVFEETHLVTQATEWRRAALRVLGNVG